MHGKGWLAQVVLIVGFMGGCGQCGVDARTDIETTSAAGSEQKTAQPAQKRLPPKQRPEGTNPIGNNLNGVMDWSNQWPFIDAMKTSRPLVSGTDEVWADERALDLDEAGWVRSLKPGQLAKTSLFTDSNAYRNGKYILTWEGEGEFAFSGVYQLVEKESGPHRRVMLFTEEKPGGVGLTIRSVDPKDPLRNFQLIRPGGACDLDRARFCDENEPCPEGECLSFVEHHEELVFHPDFLKRMEWYGMLRFMDWMSTNGSTVEHWDDRGKLSRSTWAAGPSGGVPLEVMAQLVNYLDVPPWFCIPHKADDEFVRNFARLAHKLIDPELPIWVEYSNEIWNDLFPQGRYASARAEQMGLGGDFQGRARFYAHRSVEIFRIFEEEMGADRVVRVVASHAANPWVTEQILEYPGVVEHADALAIAPYFGLISKGDEPIVKKGSVDALVEYTQEQLLPEVRGWMEAQAKLARKYGLELVAYEGGQHFVGAEHGVDDPRLNELFDAINRDPRMKDIYLQYLNDWKDAGGHWFNHFVHGGAWTKWGRWSAQEYPGQPMSETPKLQALHEFAEKNPRWW